MIFFQVVCLRQSCQGQGQGQVCCIRYDQLQCTKLCNKIPTGYNGTPHPCCLQLMQQHNHSYVAPSSKSSVYYEKICLKFASHHFLLYAVYICEKSLNFIHAFKCYQQNCSWPHFSWATLHSHMQNGTIFDLTVAKIQNITKTSQQQIFSWNKWFQTFRRETKYGGALHND